MPFYLCSLPNPGEKGVPHELISDDPAAIAAFAQREDKPGRGVYYCVSRLVPDARRRALETADEIDGLHVDINPKDIAESMDEVDMLLGMLALPPSEVRTSGRGRHVIFKFKEPLTGAAGIAEAHELLKRLANYLCGDPAVAHPAALLRQPGTHNSKGGAWALCEPLVTYGTAYDPFEIRDWLDDVESQPVFTRRMTNGHDKAHVPDGGAKPPVDVAARLAAMALKGEGDSAVHWTQLQCVGALLRQSVPLDDITAQLLEATRRAVAGDPRAAGWNWQKEEFEIMRMGLDLITKSPELAECLNDKLYAQWRDGTARLAPGEKLSTSINPHGAFFRIPHSVRKGAADGADVKEEKARADAGDPPRKFRFKLMSFGDLRPGLEPLYLVDELIPVAGLVDVWGKAKCYKSFWCLDLMLHVAMGWEYRDRYVRQGAVVYCAFEGAHGYKKRVEALRRHYDLDEHAAVPLYVMPGQANLIAEHRMLIADIVAQLGDIRPAAVVLDTLNKSLFGSENKDVDMSAYVRAAEAIRDAFGCVVVIVHHCGHDDTRPRGHSSLPGAVDAQLAVTRTEEIVTVTVEMMRDGPEDTQVNSTAEVVDVGQDQNGKTLTSLVMVPGDAAATTAHGNWPRGLAVLHAALKAALASHGQPFQPEAGVLPVRAVDQWMVRDRFYRTYAEAEEDEKKRQARLQKAFVRALAEAQSRGVAKVMRTDAGQTMVWLPERGEG